MGMTLVTGASGFVGYHLMAEMARRGLPARGVSRQEVQGLVRLPSYGSETDWLPVLAGIETVVHLAARVHIMRETVSDPLVLYRKANVEASVHLARHAAEAGVRRFVFVSSIKVNGERTTPGNPFTADDSLAPQDPYGRSKAEAEAELMNLGLRTGMDITIVRPPLVYGPGVGGNFRSLIKWATSGVPSIFPAVRNKRSFIYVANLCDLLIAALDHPGATNRVLLASDGVDLSTHELLTKLTIAAGRRPKSIPIAPAILSALGRIARHPQAVARLTESLQVDLAPTCRLLDWCPPLSVEEALEVTLRAGGR